MGRQNNHWFRIWYDEFAKIPKPSSLVTIPRDDFLIDLQKERQVRREYDLPDKEEIEVTPNTLHALYRVRGLLHPEEALIIKSGYRDTDMLTALWDRMICLLQEYYPKQEISQLFELAAQYTASPFHPGYPPHSRGDAVDIIMKKDKKSLLFLEPKDGLEGFAFDFYAKNDPEIHENRRRLREVMTSAGFKPYDKEYWHFGLTEAFISES